MLLRNSFMRYSIDTPHPGCRNSTFVWRLLALLFSRLAPYTPGLLFMLGLFSAETVCAQVVVPAGGNIYTYLAGGNRDLTLDGDAVWNTPYAMSAATSTISIEGNGHTVSIPMTQRPFDLIYRAYNSNISLTNTHYTTSGTGARVLPLFYYLEAGTTNAIHTLNLNGSSFSNFKTTETAEGGNIIWVYTQRTSASNDLGAVGPGTVTVNAGSEGVLFENNTGAGNRGGVIGLTQGKLILNGDFTFRNNFSNYYGAAITILGAQISNTEPKLFEAHGKMVFEGNNTATFGGAMDVWGYPMRATFTDEVVFRENFVLSNASRGTVSAGDQTYQPRGGAINIGWLDPLSYGATVQFQAHADFIGNYVINDYTIPIGYGLREAFGGALSALGGATGTTNYNYRYEFLGSANFDGNFVYTSTQWQNAGSTTENDAAGGAIYFQAASSTLIFSSGTRFTNNYAFTDGGAIYLQGGTIRLNAETDDIIFRDNYHRADFQATADALKPYEPVAHSGTPNAVYFGAAGTFELHAEQGQTIHFYDPLASSSSSNVLLLKTGDGDVVFYGKQADSGSSAPESAWNSEVLMRTEIQGGTFTFKDGVNFGKSGGTATTNYLITETGGTLQGGMGGKLITHTVTIKDGGGLGVIGGDFTVEADGTINFGQTVTDRTRIDARFEDGHTTGTFHANKDVTVTGTLEVDAYDSAVLILDANLVGANGSLDKTGEGDLVFLNSASLGYQGTTTITEGRLLAGQDTTSGVANLFGVNPVSALTVMAGGEFVANDQDQTVRNLSGGGKVTMGLGQLTATNDADSEFSGVISGNSATGTGLLKTGFGNLTLSGANVYDGQTLVSEGTLTATNYQAVSTGLVDVQAGAVFDLKVAADGTIVNTFVGDGTFVKSDLGNATLTGNSSAMRQVEVREGTLTFAQGGEMTVGSGGFTTYAGAKTEVGSGGVVDVTTDFIVLGEATVKQGTLITRTGGISGSGTFSALGSGGDITSTDGYNMAAGTTNILIDSTAAGNTPIEVTAGTIHLEGTKVVTAYGLAARKSTDTFTIFDASAGSAAYTGTFPMTSTVPNMKIVSDGSNTGANTRDFVLGFNSDGIPTWDEVNQRFYYPDAADKYDGWLQIDGDEDFIARFINPGSGNTEWVQALLTYLNEGMHGTNSEITLFSAGNDYAEFAVPWSELNDDADVFGWGLTYFNTTFNQNVSLFSLTVPEPSTYVLLLLGLLLAGWRRRNRSCA